jgi:hypothetical protein
MIIKTPPLSVKSVTVFPALFKAQLPDTLKAIRQAIPEWAAVHVIAQPGPARNAPTTEQMRDELLAQLKPKADLYDPVWPLSTPEIPANTVATFVPDEIRPSFASEYEGWKFVYYQEARARLGMLFDAAVGGIPEGFVGAADALCKGKLNGQAVLEAWTGSLSIPSYERTVEAMIDPQGKVGFWDTAFGFETSGANFLKMSSSIIQMLNVKTDRVYFDADQYSWFVVFYPGGEMRVAMLTPQ